MAQQRSNASKFKSPSTGEYCTTAQYIAEILIQRKAERENKGSLSYKFWNKTQKKSYTIQIQAVSKLINEFGERKVYDYIVNKNKRVFSAMPKWVKESVKKHIIPIEKISQDAEPIRDIDINTKPRKTFGKQTLFSRLNSVETNNDGKEKQKE